MPKAPKPKKPAPKSGLLLPYWCTTDKRTVRLYLGDVYETLKRMPTGSIHMAVTSPPYWGLRDYGTALWEGGSPECDHLQSRSNSVEAPEVSEAGLCFRSASYLQCQGDLFSIVCKKCGAKRIDKQLGSEEIPDCFGWTRGENCARENWATGCHVCRMVVVFHELKRVLRNDGTLWMNYGDCYKDEQLMGMPWKVALALQADGWILRQDVIWSKLNPMPESATNRRCTRSHEYVFMFSKQQSGYFYDGYAIREKTGREATSERNKRTVWEIVLEPQEGAHFATYGTRWIEPMILAGTSERGCCAHCGAPYERIVAEGTGGSKGQGGWCQKSEDDPKGLKKGNAKTTSSKDYQPGKTLGWQPTCNCNADTVPCVVFDPFMGSGTTAVVALRNGRQACGIDLSEEYLRDIAVPRIEGELQNMPALARLDPKQKKREAIDLGDSIL